MNVHVDEIQFDGTSSGHPDGEDAIIWMGWMLVVVHINVPAKWDFVITAYDKELP